MIDYLQNKKYKIENKVNIGTLYNNNKKKKK